MPPRLLRSMLFAGLALGLSPALAQSSPETTGTKHVDAPAGRAVVMNFENETALNTLAAKGKTVVFFFASWCPNCRATVTELNARWAEVNPDITLVIADYDKETALKAKFGITYQDTFVLLDETGKTAKFWNGGGVDGLNANTASF
ncbi:MAG TPA: TlpA disulfide reductase family protein [Rhizobiaceae bacterium]|nr:TlpA disulfide reductase family protein [Rhizobiaceae bacterium]